MFALCGQVRMQTVPRDDHVTRHSDKWLAEGYIGHAYICIITQAVHNNPVAPCKVIFNSYYPGGQMGLTDTACYKRLAHNNHIYTCLGTHPKWKTLQTSCWKFVRSHIATWPYRRKRRFLRWSTIMVYPCRPIVKSSYINPNMSQICHLHNFRHLQYSTKT